MKKLISVAILAGATLMAAPATVLAGGIGNNTIGPSVTFGNGQSTFGIDGKFGVADNISVRPYVLFPNNGTNFGASLTYDWDLRQAATPITPFVGVGLDVFSARNQSISTGFFQAGADLNLTRNFSLLGAVAIPFSSQNNSSTSVTLGAGLRF
jgi:hypothetical protein